MAYINKSELIARVRQRVKKDDALKHLSGVDVGVVVNRIFAIIVAGICAGERVEIRSFGSFFLKDMKERWIRNPKTGERVLSRARAVPRFVAGKKLRKLANESA